MIVVWGSQPIGYVQATVPTSGDPTEIAWVIGRQWQGQGHARHAAQLLLDELVQRGIRHVMAHIHPDHEASRRIARRLGMTPTDITIDDETQWSGLIQDV